SDQVTFPRYTLMWFIHALEAIFELTAVVRKLLSHLIEAARHVATERGPDGDTLADFELVGGHRFLDLARRWCTWTCTAPWKIRKNQVAALVQLKPVPLAE